MKNDTYFTAHIILSLFLTVSQLSVVLWPEEGDFHENSHRVVYVKINKRSVESFIFINTLLWLMSQIFCKSQSKIY